MIRELAYEAFSRAFWATMGTLARLAFWALGPAPVSAPPVRASRAHPMPIATEARVPFNAGKYGPAEGRPAAAAQGADPMWTAEDQRQMAEIVATSKEQIDAALRAEGVNVDAYLARCEATIAEGRRIAALRAEDRITDALADADVLRRDIADPRGLAREVAEAMHSSPETRGSSYVEYARNFVGDLSKGERSMLTPNLRARVEAYRAAVGAS